MTLEEAIKHTEEVAKEIEDSAKEYYRIANLEYHPNKKDAENSYTKCMECSKEHRQFAEWLKKKKKYREENNWTPCSKELPKEDGDYLVTLEKGFAEDYGSPLVIIMNFEVDSESFGYWYESFDPNTLGSLGSDWREIPVTAWKPLSEPWEGE